LCLSSTWNRQENHILNDIKVLTLFILPTQYQYYTISVCWIETKRFLYKFFNPFVDQKLIFLQHFIMYLNKKHGRLYLILSWVIPKTLKMISICCFFYCFNAQHLRVAQRIKKQSWASEAGGRGACPPWIFIHGTNIVERGLKVLFFGVFLLFFVFFCYFLVFFPLPSPLEIFPPTPLKTVSVLYVS